MSKRSEPEHPEQQHPSTKRAKQIDEHLPYDNVKELLEAQDEPKEVGTVLHWFRSKDLRIHDNRALHAASQRAKDAGKPLITIYVNCNDAFNFHGVSPARLDFIYENLRLMQEELKKLDIPLVFLDAEKRATIAQTAADYITEHGVTHVFANYEYEHDEMSRDVQFMELASAKKVFFVELRHDQTIVEPGTMLSGGGKPMKVFTPYHRAWLDVVKGDPSLIDTVPAPKKNSSKKGLDNLFDSSLLKPPKERQFASQDERKRIRKLWPAGHDAGIERMESFIKDKIDDYASTRSNPAADSTSRMSAYFSAGVVSMREVLQLLKKHNNNCVDFSAGGSDSQGVYSWVREIVFRELYRQTTLFTPHTSMNLPQNLKFDFVEWEDDEEGYKRWEEGTLGVPFVDAGMRQIRHEAYMHNRLRMNVSSYLYCNLLIDYRRGERYFASTLIDWDLSNNTQGWEPSYTVFNPVSQAEKNDPEGDYIRKWVPELKDVKGKAVFDPYERLSKEEFEKLGYPTPYVDWKETKQRCMERFKNDMSGVEP
jgi:deoxyribodipyrimidine photo-lyase